MRKFFKVFGIILAVLVAGAVIFALINLKSVLLIFGIGKLEIKAYDAAVTSLEQSGSFQNVQTKVEGGQQTTTATSGDGVVNYVITGKEGEKITRIDAQVDANKLKKEDLKITDVNALTEQAKGYISPIVSDDQVLGLTGFVAKEALAQYNAGKTQIVIHQNFDGIEVSIEGDTTTGQFAISVDTAAE